MAKVQTWQLLGTNQKGGLAVFPDHGEEQLFYVRAFVAPATGIKAALVRARELRRGGKVCRTFMLVTRAGEGFGAEPHQDKPSVRALRHARLLLAAQADEKGLRATARRRHIAAGLRSVAAGRLLVLPAE